MSDISELGNTAPFAHVLYEGATFKVWRETLPPGGTLDWHYHSEISDLFYVIRGPLEIAMRSPTRTVLLEEGATFRVDCKIEHKVVNKTPSEIEWILIQGLGRVDFQKAKGTP